ncbi:MAG: sulfatase-like hydrolase/transferase [Candidatus Sumerlaeota bacterium]|nr:sulfatase-like hydrolase/transferase [Candidatus Sumerlaeota bacterium]
MDSRTNGAAIGRREFLARVGGAAALLALPKALAAAEAPARKPNIIFVECDSMDGRAMRCMGHPAAYTPNFDRLATRGALFRNTYTNSPQCCPSRSSMWSGKQLHKCEGWNNHKGLEPNDRTFQNDLEENGYRFQTFGKLDYRSGGHGGFVGLEAWTRSADIPLPTKARPKGVVTEKETPKGAGDRKKVEQCINWLKTEWPKSDAPFFLYCGLGTPHPPFETAKQWYDKIDPAKVAIPPYEEKLHPVMEYMSISKDTYGQFTEDEIRQIRRVYFGMIADLDDMIGGFMDAVEQMGLADNTYFIFTSDHGEMNMEHRLDYKNAEYEGSARVPLIIAGPGVKPGTAVEALVSLVDISPTLIDMAGCKQPAGLDGHSLVPEMHGETSGRPDWVLSQYHSNMSNTGIFMFRRGDWKYIAYGGGYAPQLFNLKDDPDEMRNLASEKPDIVKEMDAALCKVCDYEAVDAKVKAYEKQLFIDYRKEVGDEQLRKELARCYKGWRPEQDKQIHRWLGEPEDMAPIPPSPSASSGAKAGKGKAGKKKGGKKAKAGAAQQQEEANDG